ncbi:response regulator [Paenibacillus athensensis]|uniref:Response regulatory domain-containing protein n=1 Tax=Paenibacillus athensensis TaxID=1967502 RepID=A0A4Y8PRH8_9BACL|nr:response regulator [Paenibacillus athensensis]MCD1259299.1 response regulator [Paenibacillus athensensis]
MLKAILIDDEKAMHLIVKRMLAKTGEVEVTGFFRDTASAFAYVSDHEVDIIFADISMPRENGIEFAQRVRQSGREIKIVFITSHKDYALDAFDVTAFDYLLKPVVQERLSRTVQRALADKKQVRLPPERKQPLVMELNCLGRIDIQRTPDRRAKWKSSKSAELFGYLLLHQGKLVSRTRLIEDMFASMPHKNALVYLNTTVYQLRKVLEGLGLKEQLHSDSQHYAFHPGPAFVDFLAFEEGCRRLAVIDETNLEEALQLEQLYAGDLFGEYGFAWAWSEIERFSQLYTSFTQRLSQALLKRGETNAATRLLLKLTARDELNEQSFMLLMEALAAQKNKEALVRRYEKFTSTLRVEMGIAPSAEVAGLFARLML